MTVPTFGPVAQPAPEPRPAGLDTPRPVYVAASPIPDRDRPEPMVSPEKARLRRAAFMATRAYPGPVGELLSRELLSFEELGLRLGGASLILQVADDVLEKAGPDHGDGTWVRPYSRR